MAGPLQEDLGQHQLLFLAILDVDSCCARMEE